MKNIDTPYLSLQFVLREFAKALGTNGSHTAIRDACKELEINPHKFNELKQLLVHKPIEEAVNIHFADHLYQQVNTALDRYIKLIKRIPLDGVSSSSAQSLLKRKYLTAEVSFICSEMFEAMKITPYKLAQGKQTAIQFVFQNLEKDKVWSEHLRAASKEQKDRYRAWLKDSTPEIPDLKTIAGLGENCKTAMEYMTWGVIKARLTTARIWDYFFTRSELGSLADVTNEDISIQFEKVITDLQQLQTIERDKYKVSQPIGLELTNIMRLRKPKTLRDKKSTKRLLEELLNTQSKTDPKDESTYFYYWMKARYHLHLGELDVSINNYKLAFELSMYRAGDNFVRIVTDALIVACRLPSPDKAFINKLSAASALFDISILPAESSSNEKQKPVVIEDWEISTYAQYFENYFTKDSFFPGANYPVFNGKNYGEWLVDETKYITDFKAPNKRIDVGEPGSLIKRMPQLVYFTLVENELAVKDLLEAGASVNVKSDSNESPLLFAIQAMQVTLVPLKSMKDDIFKVISSKPHTKDILELVSPKRKLTVMGTAVETGRLDIVETVLKLGGSVDQKGFRFKTPLFTCLGLIADHKEPDKVWLASELQQYNDQSLRSAMSYSPGLVPPNKVHLRQFIAQQSTDPHYRKLEQNTRDYQLRSLCKYTSLDELRMIAKVLIDNGADTNAKHDSLMLGYTPLMLAAELDEGDLFEHMLKAGGDIYSSCIVASEGRRVSCISTAKYWKAESVLEVIKRYQLIKH